METQIDTSAMMRGKRKDWPPETATLPDKPGVYLITCFVTGENYVGGCGSIYSRAASHFYQAGQSHRVEWMPPVTRCIHEHGPKNFKIEVLELCQAAKVCERERFWFLKINPSLNSNIPNGKPKRPRWNDRKFA